MLYSFRPWPSTSQRVLLYAPTYLYVPVCACVCVCLYRDMSALSSMERVSRPSTGEPVSWRLSFCYAEADLHQGYEEVTLLSGQAPATKSDQNAVSAARGVIARAWRDASSVVAPGERNWLSEAHAHKPHMSICAAVLGQRTHCTEHTHGTRGVL